MKVNQSTTLVAIVGGSGSGKSWLAKRLARDLGTDALCISLDDFYCDQSAIPPERRESINFDIPTAIEWPLFKKTLRTCATGKPFSVPKYNFKQHSRAKSDRLCAAHSVVIFDGLWLMHHPSVRRKFHISIFLDCPEKLRMHRRIQRDVAERGRTLHGSWSGFHETVNTMHNLYVEPQRSHAQHILESPLQESHILFLQQEIMGAITTRPSEYSSPMKVLYHEQTIA